MVGVETGIKKTYDHILAGERCAGKSFDGACVYVINTCAFACDIHIHAALVSEFHRFYCIKRCEFLCAAQRHAHDEDIAEIAVHFCADLFEILTLRVTIIVFIMSLAGAFRADVCAMYVSSINRPAPLIFDCASALPQTAVASNPKTSRFLFISSYLIYV